MDTSARSIFRLALIAYVLLTCVFVLKMLVIGPGALPDPAIAYLTWWLQQPHSELGRALTWVGNASLAGSVIAAFGMFAFARWARPLFLVCIVVLTGGEVLIDLPVLYTPVDHFIGSVLAIFAGGIIVFSYWSKISDAFEKMAT